MVQTWVDSNNANNGDDEPDQGIPASDILLFGTAAEMCLAAKALTQPERRAIESVNVDNECTKGVVKNWVLHVSDIAADPTATIRFASSSGLPPCPIALPPQGSPSDDYTALSNGDCQTLAGRYPVGSSPQPDFLPALYGAAAAACLGQWESARGAYERLSRPGPSLACHDQVVYDWLKVLVDAHKATNGFTSPPSQPQLPPQVNASKLPCPEATASL